MIYRNLEGTVEGISGEGIETGTVKFEFINPTPADSEAMSVGSIVYTITNGEIEAEAKLAAPAKYAVTIFNVGKLVRHFKCGLTEGDGSAVNIQTLYNNAVTPINVTPPVVFEGDDVAVLTGTGITGHVLTLNADGSIEFKASTGSGSGSGDMTKAVYDTDDDGKVNVAETADSAPWSGITDKPSTFTPSSHTHPISDITSLQATLDGKAASSHTHDDRYYTEAEITTFLAGKANTSHTHVVADTTGLQTALDGKAASSHTHVVADTTGLQAALDGKAASSHTHVIADTTGLQAALDGKAASTHNHAASEITSGTIATARLGSGSASSSTYLRGDQTWASAAAFGSSETEHYRVRAALLEPGLIRKFSRFESYNVPTTETHYHTFSWCLFNDNAKGPVRRFENRNLLNGPLPMRDITLRGMSMEGGSFGIMLNPTAVTYTNARDEYYRKHEVINGLKTRDARNTGTAIGVTSVRILGGPHGIAIRNAANFDKAWAGFMDELGDGFQSTATLVEDRRVHQEFRFTHTFKEPVIDTLDGIGVLGSGHGVDWGVLLGFATSQQTAPVNWIQYVNLPLSYWGFVTERCAPSGHVTSISTVTAGVLPARVTVVDPGAGSVTIDSDTEWLKLTSSGTDYDTGWYDDTTFSVSTGRSFICEFYYAANTKIIVGLGSNTGIGTADFTHGIEVVNGTLTVRHHNGTSQTSRTFSMFTLAVDHVYRVRVTLGASGAAYYEMQSTYAPTSILHHPIGERDWWDLLEGTFPATGPGHSTLRMKSSIGGTAATTYLLAWPRIAAAHDGVPSAPGYVWQDSLLRPLGSSAAYPFNYATSKVHNMLPDRQGTSAMQTTDASQEFAFCNATANRQPDPFTQDWTPAGISNTSQVHVHWNPGVADMIYEGSCRLLVDTGLFETFARFNGSSDATTCWKLVFRPSDGLFGIQDNTSTQSFYATSLGAYTFPFTVRYRIETRGDQVIVWFTRPNGNFEQIIDNTFANRLLKTQTYCGLRSPDAVGGYYWMGGDGVGQGLSVRRSQ